MFPTFEAIGELVAGRHSRVWSPWPNSGASRAVWWNTRRRSGKAARCAAALCRFVLTARSPADPSPDHRSAFDLFADTTSRTEAVQDAPQQGLSWEGTHDQEALDVLQPPARVARPLV